MSTKAIIVFFLTLTVLLSFCEAINYCQLGIKNKCKGPRRQGKRDDLDDVMHAYDVNEKRNSDFYPIPIPDDNLSRNEYEQLFSNVAKRDDDDVYQAKTMLQNLLRNYYKQYQRNNWEKRFF
ncbi:uncharacterized protein LOC102806251 isoform X2 [Saccoglossus kowalevskii]